MSELNRYFEAAMLAQASYIPLADYDRAAVWSALRAGLDELKPADARNFARRQADHLTDSADGFSVLYQSDLDDPQASGLSITLFRDNRTSEVHLVCRGTEVKSLSDLLTDFDIATAGIARNQILDLANLWLRLTSAKGETARQWRDVGRIVDGLVLSDYELSGTATGLGVLSADQQVNVVGHSLGGHLAIAFGWLYPQATQSKQIYAFNSAGFHDWPGVRNFIADLGGQADFNTQKVLNIYAYPGLEIASNDNLHNQVGAATQIFIESQGLASPGNHSIRRLADALGIYALFERIDADVSRTEVTRWLEAGSGTTEASLERGLNALSKCLGVEGSVGASASESSRDAFYDQYYQTQDAIDDVSGSTSLISLLDMSASELYACASDSAQVAYRYALRELNPFVITGLDYDAHNIDGSLDLYDSAQESGQLSMQWLRERAEMLVALNSVRAESDIDRRGPYITDTDGTVFSAYDSAEGRATILPAPDFFAPAFSTFGDANSNDLSGQDQADYLFGGDGKDTLYGFGGDDHLEGSRGDDPLIDGGNGNDRLLGGLGMDRLAGGEGIDWLEGGAGNDGLGGGSGADSLFGGAGNDNLAGGAGSDEYLFAAGWGVDIVYDFEGDGYGGDGNGSLQYVTGFDANGSPGKSPIAGNLVEQARNSAGERVFVLKDFTMTFVGDADQGGVLTIRKEGDQSKIVVHAFKSGSFDLHLPTEATPPISGQLFGTPHHDSGFISNANSPPGGPFIIHGGLITNANDQAVFGLDGADEIRLNHANASADGGDGNDIIYATSTGNNVDGGLGRDIIYGSAAGTRIDGGDGADIIIAHAKSGADVIRGGEGNDIIAGAAGADVIFGGDGEDYIISAGDFRVNFNAVSYSENAKGYSGTEWAYGVSVIGTYEADDRIPGLRGVSGLFMTASLDSPKFVDAGDHNDFVVGGEAGDAILGGNGDDDLLGAAGDDQIEGGEGDDFIYGDGSEGSLVLATEDTPFLWTLPKFHGDDTLFGGAGVDHMAGDGGGDTLYGGSGNDMLWGDGGKFLAAFDHGNDLLDGQEGEDELVGEGGDDLLYGGSGNDKLWGDASNSDAFSQGDDLLDGAAGNDDLYGGGGADTLIGGEGNDRLFGDSDSDAQLPQGDDDLDGGAGDDWLRGYGGDDILTGGSGVDQLGGDEGNDSLDGGDESDILESGEGADLLRGGRGVDVLRGGAGVDEYRFDTGDSVVAGNQVDAIFEDDASNLVRFGPGVAPDDLSVVQGHDTSGNAALFIRYSANDVFAIAQGHSGRIAAYLFANGGVLTHKELLARAPLVAVEGGTGDDTLSGTPVAHTQLAGGSRGTAGTRLHESLKGGAGSDVFMFGAGSGADVIADWKHQNPERYPNGERDIISIAGGWKPADIVVKRDLDGVTLLHTNAADSIRIAGLTPTTVDPLDSSAVVKFSDGTTWNVQRLVLESLKHASNGDDILIGSDLGTETFEGGAGDDFLMGRGSIDILRGGAGNDTLIGGAGADVYEFGPGDGQDTLDEQGDGPSQDQLKFKSGIARTDVTPHRLQNGDLLLAIGDGPDQVVIKNYYVPAAQSQIERISFADGGTLSQTTLLGLTTQPYVGTNDGDQLSGSAYTDTLLGLAGDDFLYGLAGNDTIYGGQGNDVLEASYGDDILDGGVGNDLLYGDWGADTFHFSPGFGRDAIGYKSGTNGATDVVVFSEGISPGDLRISKRDSHLYLTHVNGADELMVTDYFRNGVGGFSLQELRFADGTVWKANDLPASVRSNSAAHESLQGDTLNDLYVLSATTGIDSVSDPGGVDTVNVAVESTALNLYRHGNDLVLHAGAGAQLWWRDHFLASTHALEKVHFSNGQEWDAAAIAGRARSGAQSTHQGSRGDDVFSVDHTGDSVTEASGQGVDRIDSSVSFTLPNNVEGLTLTGMLAINATGNALDNTLTGNASRNLLDGLAGRDTLIGDAGDDLYRVDASENEVVVEAPGEGNDTVIMTQGSGYTLTENVENLHNESQFGGATFIGGNAMDNVLRGRNDVLSDVYDGAEGADTMVSGARYGGGTFHVDNTGDVIVSDGPMSLGRAGNTDYIISSIDWTLASSLEHLQLAEYRRTLGVQDPERAAALNATGNGLDNTLKGNSRDNVLQGLDGNDTFYGGWGVDRLIGGRGDDTYYLAGGYLGTGSISYDETDTQRDTIVEQADEGTDTVISVYDHTLARIIRELECTRVSLIGKNVLATERN